MQAKRCDEVDREAFARSAYNRYYYACFLVMREAFKRMDPSWAQNPHKSYPETLEGTIHRRLKREHLKAYKLGDSETTRSIESAQRAVKQLTKIFKVAYSVRVVADYNFDTSVVFEDSNKFSLNTVSIDDAYKWQNEVRILSESIVNAWDKFDV